MSASSAVNAEMQKLKAAVSIRSIIGETLPLKRDGRLWMGLCPFHGEKTPSFHVYEDGHYHCFGCNAHGDVFDWLEKQRGLKLADALAYLGGSRSDSPRPPPQATVQAVQCEPDDDGVRKRELAQRIWCEAVDPHATLVEAYLGSRGIHLPDADVLRFHPSVIWEPARCRRWWR
jgi:DNA primase